MMYYQKLISGIELKNKKIKSLNVSSVLGNSPKMNEMKFGLSDSPVFWRHTWAVPQQSSQNISEFYK